MRILLASDQLKLDKTLGSVLLRDHFHFFCSVDNLPVVKADVQDVAIFDLHSGVGRAVDIVASFRARTSMPIMVIMADAEPEDRSAIFNAGADVILTRPLVADELVARLDALSKRTKQMLFKGTKLTVGEVLIDLLGYTAWLGSLDLELTKAEFRVLVCLALRRGSVVSKSDLEASLGVKEISRVDHLVNTYVFSLRRKLGDSLKIETVSGSGFIIK